MALVWGAIEVLFGASAGVDPGPLYHEPCLYYDGEGKPRPATAVFERFAKAAAQGDAVAQVNPGACYANGEGVARDPAAAAGCGWFATAAAQGDAGVQYALGVCYAKAAAQGHAGARHSLSACHAEGKGVASVRD